MRWAVRDESSPQNPDPRVIDRFAIETAEFGNLTCPFGEVTTVALHWRMSLGSLSAAVIAPAQLAGGITEGTASPGSERSLDEEKYRGRSLIYGRRASRFSLVVSL